MLLAIIIFFLISILSFNKNKVEMMKQFSHRNIVKLFASFIAQDGTEISTIMEHCQYDLKKFIANRRNVPLPLDDLLTWCCQILCGLKYLHDQEIIHRDIKPEVS